MVIEYEYLRVYINSLALQAVVERVAANSSSNAHLAAANSEAAQASARGTISPNPKGYGGCVPFSTLAKLSQGDQEYIKEVVDASRNLLRTVVEGLLPGDYLRHTPVRTYFRIVSGSMFLLKVRSLVVLFQPLLTRPSD
jgi:hypothetical protein